MKIEFFIDIPTLKVASSLEAKLGFDRSKFVVEFDEETNGLGLVIEREMIADYDSINSIEGKIEAIARQYGATYQGFGTEGNVQNENG